MDRRTAGAIRRAAAFTLLELLIVAAIILVLTTIVAAALLSVGGARKVAMAEIKSLSMAIEAYRHELGAYPTDDAVALGGTPEHRMSEALVHHLGRRITKGANSYGPYMLFREKRLTNADTDGFPEYPDPWGRPYLYAENASEPTRPGMNPASYDLVSAGLDGELGGAISPATGYVPASTPEGKECEKDNVTNWGK